MLYQLAYVQLLASILHWLIVLVCIVELFVRSFLLHSPNKFSTMVVDHVGG